MKAKQLELNVDKCGTILFGKGKRIQQIKDFIAKNKSLSIDGIDVKMKQEDKYLGDYIHCLGLSKSVESTYVIMLSGWINLSCRKKSMKSKSLSISPAWYQNHKN